MEKIYLDSASTTHILPSVLEATKRTLCEDYGNPSSIHSLGLKSKEELEKARNSLAKLIECDSNDIVFTSGATESNTMALLGLKDYLISSRKTHIITTGYEHKSVLKSIEKLQRDGCSVSYINKRGITANDIRPLITNKTGLVSIMYSNNEFWSPNDIESIGNLCNKTGLLLHSDCVQSLYCLPVPVKSFNIDLCSVSGHKIHAPKGVGALCIRSDKVKNILYGGSQEFGIRPGTENLSGISGFGEAANLFSENLPDIRNYISRLSQVFKQRLLEKIPEIKINNEGFSDGIDKVLSVSIHGIDSESLLMLLDSNGVYVSAGSACNSKSVEPSHALTAIGIPKKEISSTIRFSFSILNSENEIYRAIDIIHDCVSFLRKKFV